MDVCFLWRRVGRPGNTGRISTRFGARTRMMNQSGGSLLVRLHTIFQSRSFHGLEILPPVAHQSLFLIATHTHIAPPILLLYLH